MKMLPKSWLQIFQSYENGYENKNIIHIIIHSDNEFSRLLFDAVNPIKKLTSIIATFCINISNICAPISITLFIVGLLFLLFP